MRLALLGWLLFVIFAAAAFAQDRPPGAAPSPLKDRPESAPVAWKGWGTLTGRFVFKGEPPKLAPLPNGRDVAVCGAVIPNESLVIGKDGGLAYVAVWLRTAGTPWEKTIERRKEPVLLDIKGCRFVPRIFGLTAGDELRVTNSDPIGHNVRADLQGESAFNVVLAPRKDTTQKVRTTQTWPAILTNAIHPHMRGYVVVCESSYFAVTDDSGRFQIQKLPAGGPLEFQFWHERTGFQLVDVAPRGRLTIELTADETKDLGDLIVKPELVK
jgi:hypothetical protein